MQGPRQDGEGYAEVAEGVDDPDGPLRDTGKQVANRFSFTDLSFSGSARVEG